MKPADKIPNDSFLFQMCTVLNVVIKLTLRTFFEMPSTILYAGVWLVMLGIVFKCQVQFYMQACSL